MAKYKVGDPVVAVKDIGGVIREQVPKGSRGVVSDPGGWSSRTKVIFTVKGGLFSDDKRIEIEVDEGEIS